ncbi:uncharacterized protein LOC116849039 [Odontomachus brunneus]|uniref:uncharacterized protein LOC116849039 n=1 Tax=Odontomachus brunneus TaxID=486640 RepID=UPI0013F2217F|nr:uncharacterized protein LOC116849039 [Odontomachus brunneus]XP_032681657.1 uncharacterized protein LOC116849039 [Odontomachus brunneus]XP_032681658.1 uncharacterized protein LOC116849039 [Odontomachus brunneus]XP_032681659.1 uncharacterized protein LOC116849039 [Odontomachus brunneus]
MAIFTDFLSDIIHYPCSNDYMCYDDFFHPNVCHVCKKTNDGDLIICDRCYMVSYCSNLHLLVDRSHHQKFCSSIKKYVIDKNGRNWRSIRFCTFRWIQSRYEFLHEISMQFSYNLALYQIQMIIFAKSCYMCHQQNYLHPCQTCYSEHYCVEHAKHFSDFHSPRCQALKLYFNSYILYRNFRILGYTMDTYREQYIEFPDDKRSVENMENFITGYGRNYHHRNIRAWTYDEYVYSDYVSRPLTLYDGMKKAGLLDTLNVEECVVHIISESFVERQYVYAWEILLHLLHRIKSLKIVLIGKRLKIDGFYLQTCKNCIKRRQIYMFESYSMFYNEYASSPSFQHPNVVVTFQACFNVFQWTWINIILESGRIKCPFFLTAGSGTIAEENVQNIRKFIKIEPIYNAPNSFKSHMPCRLLSYTEVGYPNSYVTIYDNLNSQKSETETSSPLMS